MVGEEEDGRGCGVCVPTCPASESVAKGLAMCKKAASQEHPCTEQMLAPTNLSHPPLPLSLSIARQAGLEAERPHRGVQDDGEKSSLLSIKVRVCAQVYPSSPEMGGGVRPKGLSRFPLLIPIPIPTLSPQ